MKDIDTPAGLTRAILADQAIGWAQAFLPLIRNQQNTEESAAAYGALCIYYGRPFTDNNGLGVLSTNIVPSNMSALHKKLILFRNKISAHSDSAHDHQGTYVNAVYFRSDGHQVIVENRHLAPTPNFLNDVERLLNEVKAQLSTAISKCLSEGKISKTAFPKGLYRVSDVGNGDWLLPVADDRLEDS